MNEFCKYCGLCCKIIPVKNRTIIKDGCRFDDLIPLSKDEAIGVNNGFVKDIENILGKVELYRCKYISDDNICKNPNKSSDCSDYPSSGLSIIPEECCYIGEVFLKREALKQKVRKFKEEIIHYEALINSGDKESESYKKIMTSLQRFIDKYSIFGSENW